VGTFYFPPQDAYHLLQHRLSLAQRKKLQPAPIATLTLLTSLDLKILLLQRHLAAPLPPFTLPLLVVWATKQWHSHQKSGSKRNTVPISPEESDDDESPEEFRIHGQSLRPGPISSLRPRKSTVNHDLSEIDDASILLHDAEATQFWPLTEGSS